MNSNLKSIILSFIQMDHFLDSNLIKWPEAIHQNDVGTDAWHLSCPKGEQKSLTVPPLPSEPRVGPIFVNVLTAFFTPEAGRFQGRAWWEHSKILWWRSPSLVFIASLLAAWFSTLAPINPQRSSTIPGDSCQNSAIRAIWEWLHHSSNVVTWGHCNSSNRYVDCIETHRPNSTWGVIQR